MIFRVFVIVVNGVVLDWNFRLLKIWLDEELNVCLVDRIMVGFFSLWYRIDEMWFRFLKWLLVSLKGLLIIYFCLVMFIFFLEGICLKYNFL